jgi:hypothetical protein
VPNLQKTACEACPSNQVPNLQKTACEACPPGKEVSSSGEECIDISFDYMGYEQI